MNTPTAWLDMTRFARVEASSQQMKHPIEDAFSSTGDGWRAAEGGAQIIRVHFHSPRGVSRIRLVFYEGIADRTQEFTLEWSAHRGETHCQIVRQQFTFGRLGATRELHEYDVELHDVSGLELRIVPDINGGDVLASLAECKIA